MIHILSVVFVSCALLIPVILIQMVLEFACNLVEDQAWLEKIKCEAADRELRKLLAPSPAKLQQMRKERENRKLKAHKRKRRKRKLKRAGSY